MMDADLIEALADEVERRGLDERAMVELRKAHPGIHFTLCSDDDVPARLTAAAARGMFNIYLVNSAEHCAKFTTDPEQASGLVFATLD